MMPGWARCGDVHACGAVAVGCSSSVFADGRGVHRCGDADAHCGTTVQVECSATVFANGRGVARCGDNHAGDPCPHPPNPHVSCSATTFANG